MIQELGIGSSPFAFEHCLADRSEGFALARFILGREDFPGFLCAGRRDGKPGHA
jgi:hypothetical protein